MTINTMRQEMAQRSKRGLPFILGSVLIWTGVTVVWWLPYLEIQTRNLLTFCLTTPLLPLAYLISRFITAEFSVQGNPLNELGLLFSLNQVIYLLIAMWAYNAVPERMVMILAMIFGAHLLPYGWLYQSRSYLVFSILIPIGVLLGAHLLPELYHLPLAMIFVEVVFSTCLVLENHRASRKSLVA